MNQAYWLKLKRLSVFACSGALVVGLAGCGGNGLLGIPIVSYHAIAWTQGSEGRNAGVYTVSGRDSAAEAQNDALSSCRSRASNPSVCQLAFPAFTNCGAVAGGDNGRDIFAATGASRQDAISNALNRCRNFSSGCFIARGSSGRELVVGEC